MLYQLSYTPNWGKAGQAKPRAGPLVGRGCAGWGYAQDLQSVFFQCCEVLVSHPKGSAYLTIRINAQFTDRGI